MSIGEFENRSADLSAPQPHPQHHSEFISPHAHQNPESEQLSAQDHLNADDLDQDDLDSDESVEDTLTSSDTLYTVHTPSQNLSGNGRLANNKRVLQRIAEVRKQQGVSRRNVARRLNIDMETVRAHEDPTCDIPLSMLCQYQQLLEVPMADLIAEQNDGLSSGIMDRARLVRLMKTAATILEKAEGQRIRRLAQMLVEQLVDIMPELKGVAPWHTVGRRRTLDDYGRTLERVFSEDIFKE